MIICWKHDILWRLSFAASCHGSTLQYLEISLWVLCIFYLFPYLYLFIYLIFWLPLPSDILAGKSCCFSLVYINLSCFVTFSPWTAFINYLFFLWHLSYCHFPICLWSIWSHILLFFSVWCVTCSCLSCMLTLLLSCASLSVVLASMLLMVYGLNIFSCMFCSYSL